MNDEMKINEDFDFFPFTDEELRSIKRVELGAGEDFSFLPGGVLERISYMAFERLSFSFTKEHIENIIKLFSSGSASPNDKYVCASILRNAEISAQQKFPLCQDTGIANIFAWKHGIAFTKDKNAHSEYESISRVTEKLYDEKKLRFSTSCPKDFFDEYDPKNNMPAQISIFEKDSSLAPIPPFAENVFSEYKNAAAFIFCAKGGGSSNKTSFIQGTKASLTEENFKKILKEQIEKLGTSACPPYTIASVAGGLSPEQNLLALKLATCGAYDKMTYEANAIGFRDKYIEEEMMKIACQTGFGAQFGGSAFALDTIALRLSRHGASCPISVGVSCSAHRNLKAFVTEKGFFLEKTVTDFSKIEGFKNAVNYLDEIKESSASVKISTNEGIEKTLSQLDGLTPGTQILLSGKILVARDAAHARWKKNFENDGKLPEYTKKYPVCYAGPARTPEGEVIGSFGPTTAGRMDSYADFLMEKGASLVTLAKGNRSENHQNACKKYGGFYLGTPGGIAALIASKYIESQEIIDFEELGMEAVRLVEVKDLPCFVITDNRGNDFYRKRK